MNVSNFHLCKLAIARLVPAIALLALLMVLPHVSSEVVRERFTYAEVWLLKDGGWCKSYALVIGNSLKIAMDGAQLLCIRVDSFSKAKPLYIRYRGKEFKSSVNGAVLVLGDSLLANLTRLGISKGTIEVVFEEGQASVPVVLLLQAPTAVTAVTGENAVPHYGGLEVWGAILRAVAISDGQLGSAGLIRGAPFFLLNRTKLDKIGGKDLVSLCAIIKGKKFSLDERVISANFTPLYVIKCRTEERRVYTPSTLPPGNYLLYVNPPLNAKLRIKAIAGMLASTPVGKPALYVLRDVKAGNVIAEYVQPPRVTVTSSVTEGMVLRIEDARGYTQVATPPINLSLPLNGSLKVVVALSTAEVVAEYVIDSLAPRVVIPVPLYSVSVVLKGVPPKLPGNLTLELRRVRGLNVVVKRVIGNRVDLGRVVAGTYLARVLWKGREVSRKLVNITKDLEIVMVCKLSMVKLTIMAATGEALDEFKVRITGGDIVEEVEGTNGSAIIGPLPYGRYRLTITRGGVELLSEELEFSQPEVAISKMVDIYFVKCVVMDALGAPVPGAAVTLRLRGSVRASCRAGDDGKCTLEAYDAGKYELCATVRGIVVEEKACKLVSLRRGVKVYEPIRLNVVSLRKGVVSLGELYLTAFLAVAVALAYALRKALRRKGEEVIILEQEG